MVGEFGECLGVGEALLEGEGEAVGEAFAEGEVLRGVALLGDFRAVGHYAAGFGALGRAEFAGTQANVQTEGVVQFAGYAAVIVAAAE